MKDPLLIEAIERFHQAFLAIQDADLREPCAMALATSSPQGRPSVRIVLLRGYDEQGFVFYTNSLSRKGKDLADNSQAALAFYWDRRAEQVRIEGSTEIVSPAECDVYWKQRPRSRQIASAASQQSAPLRTREEYLQQIEILEKQFAGLDIPRPSHWVGYRVRPNRIEFWNGNQARMHERVLYERMEDGRWSKGLLYP